MKINNNIHRIIDANLNRLKEGLRVCEEIARFVLDDYRLTADLKRLRHGVDRAAGKICPVSLLLEGRNSRSDVGRLNSRGELKRCGCKDIFRANLQRAKESLRVLEEFSKLADEKSALSFKRLRYEIYALEKDSFKKISSLPDCG
ncbi:MAG: thiamine-phosphate pyrophosphorylase [Candidatus Omnitrophica bacterium]|nr:thiamine-phosphate pyrophosphorylase [Candidatus Omnitrophota bacterium]MDD5771648.1 thiamine-phosphate pyrophosphorylase [Candidatus Omnitrophota bacterium]